MCRLVCRGVGQVRVSCEPAQDLEHGSAGLYQQELASARCGQLHGGLLAAVQVQEAER